MSQGFHLASGQVASANLERRETSPTATAAVYLDSRKIRGFLPRGDYKFAHGLKVQVGCLTTKQRIRLRLKRMFFILLRKQMQM